MKMKIGCVNVLMRMKIIKVIIMRIVYINVLMKMKIGDINENENRGY